MNDNAENLCAIADKIEHVFKPEKGKESILLLKQKMCKTNELIQQHNDKVKECDRLNLDLETTKKEVKNMIHDYESIMMKTRELELKITENEQKNDKLTCKINDYEIIIAADKQNIQQLTCKIKEMEEQHSLKIMEFNLQESSLQDKIRNLEHELKILKKDEIRSKRRARKVSLSHNDTVSKSSSDIGVNVSLYDNLKPDVQEKSIMTDEFYKFNNDPYPLFCSKCEAHLYPAPIEKICKIMSKCPELIEEDPFSSPQRISFDMQEVHTDKNEDIVPCEILHTPHSTNSYKSYIENMKRSENPLVIDQNFDNELKHTSVTPHIPVKTNLFSNLDLISVIPSSQSISYTKEDASSSNLLAEHSLSIKKIERKIQLLQSDMKKLLRKLKKKQNTSCCHHRCVMNYNNDTSLNSELLTTIYKSMIEFYNDKTERCFKTKQNTVSEKYIHSNIRKIKLKRKRLNKNNAHKMECSWRIEHVNNNLQQDSACNKSENSTMTDNLQYKHELLYMNNSCPLPYVNMLTSSCNYIDDKEFASHEKTALQLVRATSVDKSSMISDLSETCTSNNLSSNDKVETNTNNYIVAETSSSTSDVANSIIHDDNKIIDIITIEKNFQNKEMTSNSSSEKIRNLKRKMQTNLGINSAQESTELSSNLHNLEYDIPMKRREIACILETSVSQSNITQKDVKDSTESIIEPKTSKFREKYNKDSELYMQTKEDNLSEQNEKDYITEKEIFNKNSVAWHNETFNEEKKKSIKEKNLISTNIKDFLADNESNIERSSTIKDFHDNNFSIKDVNSKNLLTEKIMAETSNSSNKLSTLHNNITDNTMKDIQFKKLGFSKTCFVTQSGSHIPYQDCKTDEFTETAEMTKIMEKKISSIDKSRYNINENIVSHNNINKSCNDHSSKVTNNIITMYDESNVSAIGESMHHESYNNVISDKTMKYEYLSLLRDSEVVNDCFANKDNRTESVIGLKHNETDKQASIGSNEILNTKGEDVGIKEYQRKSINILHDNIEDMQTPISQLNRYINKKSQINGNCKQLRKNITYVRAITDKFVKKQLQRLANNTWETAIHCDVIQKLINTCESRIIAKCVVEFLTDYMDSNDILDKSFTPPAPLMTTFQQKIVTLLVDLEILTPMVIHFTQAGIEYKLFKLNNHLQKTHIETLTRIYVVLARIQKDRERIRMMCCDALYCMGFHAINLLYTVFTCWPEVLPSAEANKEILPKCIAFLIISQHIEGTYRKLLPLKTLISSFYKYSVQKTASEIVDELLNVLKVKRDVSLETAVILIAKREGTAWTYKNIIRSILLPMIINFEHSCIYNAFCLLGKLMRTFPLEDKDNIVTEICEQLRDLMESGEGSDEQQEGIASALLSLSRHKFDIVSASLIKWIPNKSLRPYTMAQVEAFIKTRSPKFWKCYLERNKCMKYIENKT